MPQAPFLPASAQPYPVLLDAYPHPAFIVRTDSTLRPIWINKALDSVLGDVGVQLRDSFVHILASAEDGQRYGLWSAEDGEIPRTVRTGKKRCRTEDEGESSTSANSTTVTVRVRLATGEGELQLVKTRLDNLLIVTSILKSQHPLPVDKVSPVPSKRVRADKFTGSLAPLPPLRLPSNHTPLTPERTPVLPTFSPTSSRSSANGSTSNRLQHTLGAVVPGPRPTSTQTLYESHAWENTPLGARSTWPERLRACVNIMQTSPHAVSSIPRRSSVT